MVIMSSYFNWLELDLHNNVSDFELYYILWCMKSELGMNINEYDAFRWLAYDSIMMCIYIYMNAYTCRTNDV